MDRKPINTFLVDSLEDYLRIVSDINEINNYRFESKRKVSPMWYRGNKRQHYNLIPTLLRDSKGEEERYNRDHLREDYRYQHFRSKCNQLVDINPRSRIEWTEVMQHYCAYTRMMDWSESAITALMFALEYFIEPGNEKGQQYKRSTSTPTVWVLNPVGLNAKIYNGFIGNKELIRQGLEEVIPVGLSEDKRRTFLEKIEEHMVKGCDRFLLDPDDPYIQGIVCLAAMEADRVDISERMFYLLDSGEYNPFFYLLLRYYSDGLPIEKAKLPPLAIVHPYHSSRIQAQHGVFTVTPHYKIDKKMVKGPEDCRAMELQPNIFDCLYKIRIMRPAYVAKELLVIGERRTSIFPEMDNYAKDIEVKEYMI